MVQTSISSWLFRRAGARVENESCEEVELRPADDLNSMTKPLPEAATGPPEGTGNLPESRRNENMTSSGSSIKLPSNVSVEYISPSNVKAFKRLISLLLPIPYPDNFYTETLEDDVISSVSRAAIWHNTPKGVTTNSPRLKAAAAESTTPSAPLGAHRARFTLQAASETSGSTEAQLVAAIRCRVLAHPPDRPTETKPVLYISTITTLAPFRGHALGSNLLERVATTAAREYGTMTVMAHVWEANEDGIEWYKKRGFRIEARVEDYYRRLAPQTAAYLIRKDVSMAELLEWDRRHPAT